MSQLNTERRRATRHPVRMKVRFWNHEDAIVRHVGYTGNVSSSGLFVECDLELPVGTRLHLEMFHGEQVVLGEGLVVRKEHQATGTSQAKIGFGVRFLGWEEMLAGILEAAMAGQAVSDIANTSNLEALKRDLTDWDELLLVFEAEIRQGKITLPTERALPIGSSWMLRIRLPEPYGYVDVQGEVFKEIDFPPSAVFRLADPEDLIAIIKFLLSVQYPYLHGVTNGVHHQTNN